MTKTVLFFQVTWMWQWVWSTSSGCLKAEASLPPILWSFGSPAAQDAHLNWPCWPKTGLATWQRMARARWRIPTVGPAMPMSFGLTNQQPPAFPLACHWCTMKMGWLATCTTSCRMLFTCKSAEWLKMAPHYWHHLCIKGLHDTVQRFNTENESRGGHPMDPSCGFCDRISYLGEAMHPGNSWTGVLQGIAAVQELGFLHLRWVLCGALCPGCVPLHLAEESSSLRLQGSIERPGYRQWPHRSSGQVCCQNGNYTNPQKYSMFDSMFAHFDPSPSHQMFQRLETVKSLFLFVWVQGAVQLVPRHGLWWWQVRRWHSWERRGLVFFSLGMLTFAKPKNWTVYVPTSSNHL